MTFAPDSLRTDQDSDGGEGRQCPSPLFSRFNQRWINCSNVSGLSGLATSCLIGKSLSLDAFKRALGAASVVNAELFPVVVAEIKFGKITPQVFLGNVLINAIDATFQDREESFDRISVNCAAYVFAISMSDGAVRSKIVTDESVDFAFVAHQVALLIDVASHDAAKPVGRNRRYMERAHLALALNKGEYGMLLCGWQEGFAGRLAAHVGFVDLNRDASAAKAIREDATVIGHGLTDTVAEEPSGFHAAIEHPLDLPGRNALLAGAKQMNDLQPQMQRQMAVLENRADPHREGLFAGVAFVAVPDGSSCRSGGQCGPFRHSAGKQGHPATSEPRRKRKRRLH